MSQESTSVIHNVSMVSEETEKIMQSGSLDAIEKHFQSSPIEGRKWCRDASRVKAWIRGVGIPKKITFEKAPTFREVMLSEHETLFEVVCGRHQMEIKKSSEESLQSDLDSLFESQKPDIGSPLLGCTSDDVKNNNANDEKERYNNIRKTLEYIVKVIQLPINEKRYSNGRTLLHFIVCCADERYPLDLRMECCRYLVENGALPIQDTFSKENPIHTLCYIAGSATVAPQEKRAENSKKKSKGNDSQKSTSSPYVLDMETQNRFIELLDVLVSRRPEALQEESDAGDCPLHVLCRCIPEKDSLIDFHMRVIDALTEFNRSIIRKENREGKRCIDLISCGELKNLLMEKYKLLNPVTQDIILIDESNFRSPTVNESDDKGHSKVPCMDDFF